MWSSWFYDDGYFIAPLDILGCVLDRAVDIFSTVGITINIPKCQLLPMVPTSSTTNSIPLSLRCVRDASLTGGLCVFGTPFRESCVSCLLEERAVALKLLCSRLIELNDAHVAYHLLRTCLAAGRITHLLRTVPSEVLGSRVADFSFIVRSTLDHL